MQLPSMLEVKSRKPISAPLLYQVAVSSVAPDSAAAPMDVVSQLEKLEKAEDTTIPADDMDPNMNNELAATAALLGKGDIREWEW